MEQITGVSRRNIYIAILLSVGVSAYLIYTNFDIDKFKAIKWTGAIMWSMVLSALFISCRHLGYMLRLRLITDKALSWRQCFDCITVWEFASCATPSSVGGAAVAMFILNREKLNMGQSTASIMAISFLDNVFFITASLIGFLLVGSYNMFNLAEQCGKISQLNAINEFGGLEYIFWLGFGFSAIITFLLGYGVFGNAIYAKRVLMFFTSLPFLKRYRATAEKTGDELLITSKAFKSKPFRFWLQLVAVTVMSWSLKFLIVNLLISAFGEVLGSEQLIVFSKVLSLWVIMLIPLTPGSSGVAEITFMALMCRFVDPGIAATVTFSWRLFTYYPYLILGAIVTPRWMRRTAILRATTE